MVKINIQSIMEGLDHDMKRALEEAVEEVYPDLYVDKDKLYKAFRRAIRRKFSTWVNVPKGCVEE